MHPVLRLIAVFGLSLLMGLGSAWYMIGTGSAFTTGRIGPWNVWYSAGNPNADPYTRAHFARSGRLPITSTSALYYEAKIDSEGDALTADCEYVIEGQPLDAGWWSLALYEASGRLIPNKADRHAFSNRDLAFRTDGSYQIVLARTARPGNWLPTGDGGKIKLVLRVYVPRGSNSLVRGRLLDARLPEILRLDCQ